MVGAELIGWNFGHSKIYFRTRTTSKIIFV